ncbi:glutamate 5-kinase [Candidatus Mycalebacterium sp.]
MSVKNRIFVKNAKTAVIKIGSSVLLSGSSLDETVFGRIARQVACLREAGIRVVIVSSGAIAAGMKQLGLRTRPDTIRKKQAVAACGQSNLIRNYETAFFKNGFSVAQVLLTQDGLSDRRCFLNARGALSELLQMGVIPVVNENDTVAVEEIMFGDNDNLAAIVAAFVEADLLLMLTNTDGVYDSNPENDSNARLLPVIKNIDAVIEKSAGGTSGATTTGGMKTKLQAAAKASAFGIPTIIADGRDFENIGKIFRGDEVGTLVVPTGEKLAARKHWIAHTLKPRGEITLDEGASKAVGGEGKSLLPSGVTKVSGEFGRGDPVLCLDPQGAEVARGLVSYSSDEVERIRGAKAAEIEAILGYKYGNEIIHRDNLVVLVK